MLRGRPVAADGIQGRAADVFMLLQPAVAQLLDGNRFKPERRGRAGFELRIDFGGELLCLIAIRTDARLPAPAMVAITEIPAAAEVSGLGRCGTKWTFDRLWWSFEMPF